MTEIIVKPFDWNDNFSEVAQEDFSMIWNFLRSKGVRLNHRKTGK